MTPDGYAISILRDRGRGAAGLAFSRPEDAPAGQEMPLQRIGCEMCGAALHGRQVRFCSDAHRMEFWTKTHPRVRVIPKAEGQAIRSAVLGLMVDYAWRTVAQIAAELGIRESTAGAKLRDLRKPAYGGFTVQAEKLPHSAEYRFRLRRTFPVEPREEE